MRYLHPVGLNETFVASGIYTHYENDGSTGSVEHWSIHEQPDGAQFIRVDDDWRERDGSSVLIEAWRSPAGRTERFDIHAFGGKDDDIHEVRATFTVIEGYLEVGRSINNEARQQIEIQLSENYVVAPESLIFGGFEVVRLEANSATPLPVVSYLPTFLNETAAFRPNIYEQIAIFLRDDILEIGSHTYPCRVFQQGSTRDDLTLTLWVDVHDVLLKYTTTDERHSAVLTQYARRP